MWLSGGFAFSNAVRLGSNLVLTRLLFPEAFGIMALVSAFMQGLKLFSDIGVHTALIQNPRGDEEEFLNTAWTMQVGRGGLLFIASCAIAWPASVIYAEPALKWFIPVAGFTAFITGFNATAISTLRRHMRFAQLALYDGALHLINAISMIIIAWMYRSIWALVLGGVISGAVGMVASHLLLPGIRNRFRWDPAAAHALYHFGKWIFLSTALGFISLNLDRFLLGYYLGNAAFGVYSIALMLSVSLEGWITRLVHGVMYPAFSKVARETPRRMKEIYYRVRLRLDLVSLSAAGFTAIAGSWIIDVLYDDRYFGAGWILQWLAIRTAMACILTPCETCLFALGHTKYGFFRNLARAIWVGVGVPLGWWLGGIEGVVMALALSELPVLLVLWPPFVKLGLLDVWLELRAVLGFLLGALVGMVVVLQF